MAGGTGQTTTGGASSDFLSLVKTRRSIRRYRAEPVPRETLLSVLEAARWAPSAVNGQPWHFLVVNDPQRRRELADRARLLGLVRWKHIASAPVVVAILGDPRGNRFVTVDCSLAGMNLLLAAHVLGLGACWIGGFEADKIRGLLGVPRDRDIVGLVTLGWPDETPAPPPRLPLERLVSWEVYDSKAVATRGERFRNSGLYSVRKRVVALLRGGWGKSRAKD